jgi:opacity protein-like surface antigen
MMKKTVQGLMVLAALLWGTDGAQARDLLQNMQMDVFVLGGGSTLVDATYFDSAGRLYHTRFEPNYKITVGGSMPYGKLLNIETAFTFGPNNLVLTNTNLFPHVGIVYPVRDYIGSVSAVVHAPFSRYHFRPYAEGGIEYDRFSPTPAAVAYARNNGWASVSSAIINHNDKFGINVGVGIDRKLTKRLTFRIDMRDHVTSSPAFGIPPKVGPLGSTLSTTSAIFPVKGRANNMVYTAGIIYHLGKL